VAKEFVMSEKTPRVDAAAVCEGVIEELIKLRIVVSSMLEVMLMFGPLQLTEDAAHQLVMDLFADLEAEE
jgi:hypothetical protein